jgi:fructose-1-phosphate kinase PfkB-like protein
VTGGWVLVSRGAKPALLVNVSEGFSLFLKPVRVKPRNTVGAGDALLAAVALSIRRGESPAQWLRAGLQAGAIAVRSHAGQWPH